MNPTEPAPSSPASPEAADADREERSRREVRRVAERLRRQVRELDVAHTVSREAGAPLEWQLDPEPLVLDASTWDTIESAVRQRARLVNCLLADVYGAQETLRLRLVPPDLVLGDAYFRRPCVGLEPRRASLATVLRLDLIRDVGGRWVFFETYANTPIGLSYAVQNRRLLAQERGDFYAGLPEFRSVINFPIRLLDQLKRLSPRETENPNVVVLTPGPQDNAYFEHSFLARKMGLPLAQGGDLLVLDEGVYFKTVAGLVPVDVIYRRLNDDHIDPVVFPTTRSTGVPGLVASIRAGRVALANSIGVGLADNRALEAYVPRLLRYFLGEKPVLPGVPTYYCADVDQFGVVLDDTDGELALLPAQALPADLPGFLPGRSLDERARVLAALRSAPQAYVARRVPEPDHARTSLGDRTHRATHLSCFALCDGRKIDVMPGGLVRLLPRQPTEDLPVWQVGVTADLVVLTPPEGAPPEPPTRPPEQVRPLLLGSRAADNLFWAGRYAERAEATARILSIVEDVGLEEITRRERAAWFPVWRAMVEATGHGPILGPTGQEWYTPELAWHMTLEAANAASVLSNVRAARDNLRLSRDIFSPETWRLLSRLDKHLGEVVTRAGRPGGRRPEVIEQAIGSTLDAMAAFFGTFDRTMLHDISWHFFQIGVQLERAIMTTTALQHVITDLEQSVRDRSREEADLSAFVRMLSSQDAYRRTYQARAEPLLVAELFLRNEHAPKSVHACVRGLRDSLEEISRVTGSEDDAPLLDVRKLLQGFVGLDLERFFTRRTDSPRYQSEPQPVVPSVPAAPAGRPPASLGLWLTDLLARLRELGSGLHDFYLSHQARLLPPRVQG